MNHIGEKWISGFGQGVTGPNTPAIGGATVHEQIMYRSWQRSFEEWRDNGRKGEMPRGAYALHVPVTVGMDTVAIAVGETKEIAGAHADHIVKCVNAFEDMRVTLNRMTALMQWIKAIDCVGPKIDLGSDVMNKEALAVVSEAERILNSLQPPEVTR